MLIEILKFLCEIRSLSVTTSTATALRACVDSGCEMCRALAKHNYVAMRKHTHQSVVMTILFVDYLVRVTEKLWNSEKVDLK